MRQITDYVTLLVTTPILLFAAATVSAAAQSSSVIVFLRERLRLGPTIDFALGFTPLAVAGLAFFAMYVILPNVRVRPPALLGAALAAVGWQVSLVLHVQLQMGVAKYNALYSVLGALDLPRLDVCLVARRARRWRSRRVTRTSRWWQRLRGRSADRR